MLGSDPVVEEVDGSHVWECGFGAWDGRVIGISVTGRFGWLRFERLGV